MGAGTQLVSLMSPDPLFHTRLWPCALVIELGRIRSTGLSALDKLRIDPEWCDIDGSVLPRKTSSTERLSLATFAAIVADDTTVFGN